MTRLIEANTTIPTRKTETFSTAADNQSSVEIHILQGERPMSKDNRSLGRFNLDGIMPAPRGVPQIEVTLDIDANGILSVNAKDKATGKENKIRIEGGSQLSKEEIERMKAEAEANAESDRQEREAIEKINQADSLIFQTEKQLKEFSSTISDLEKTELENALVDLKESHKNRNLIDIDSSTIKLNEIWNRVSSRIYKDSSTSDNSTTDPKSTDVEYEEEVK